MVNTDLPFPYPTGASGRPAYTAAQLHLGATNLWPLRRNWRARRDSHGMLGEPGPMYCVRPGYSELLAILHLICHRERGRTLFNPTLRRYTGPGRRAFLEVGNTSL